jgi:hypothetical protein
MSLRLGFRPYQRSAAIVDPQSVNFDVSMTATSARGHRKNNSVKWLTQPRLT